uniref:EGF-like domain-containing protein n=1 Tax=Caenorhabditis japonica TaxID=281687 RepID=A0A8R1I2L8_CAEJA
MRTRTLFLLLLMAFFGRRVNCGGQSLVSPQSACKIRCENGGMCVFDMDRPDVHSCICLLGVFTGERCQIKVPTDDEDGSTTTTTTTTAPPPTAAPIPSHPRNIHHQQTYQQPDAEQSRRRDDDERKREYERLVAERERASDEQKRRQQHEQYWREETARREQQRVEAERRVVEQRARDDERRRLYEAERVQQEERRRDQENLRLAAERKAEEDARLRDEERRRQEAEMAEKRVNEQFEYDGEDEDYPQVAEKENDDEYDEGYETEKSGTATVTKQPEVAGDDDGSDMVMQKDYEEEEEAKKGVKVHGKVEEKEEGEPLPKEDEKLIDSIKHVFDKAVEETVKEHPIEDDEYWDESGKKMGEEEKAKKAKNEDGEEYGMEEGTEGWMMVKKDDENAASRLFLFLSTLFTVIFLF